MRTRAACRSPRQALLGFLAARRTWREAFAPQALSVRSHQAKGDKCVKVTATLRGGHKGATPLNLREVGQSQPLRGREVVEGPT